MVRNFIWARSRFLLLAHDVDSMQEMGSELQEFVVWVLLKTVSIENLQLECF